MGTWGAPGAWGEGAGQQEQLWEVLLVKTCRGGAGMLQRTPWCLEVFGHEVPGRSLGAWDLQSRSWCNYLSGGRISSLGFKEGHLQL